MKQIFRRIRSSRPLTLRRHVAYCNAPATAGEVERITGMLFCVLRASGYTDPRRIAATEENVRRLVRRLNLPARDVEFWLGILRQITWKVDSGGRAKS